MYEGEEKEKGWEAVGFGACHDWSLKYYNFSIQFEAYQGAQYRQAEITQPRTEILERSEEAERVGVEVKDGLGMMKVGIRRMIAYPR